MPASSSLIAPLPPGPLDIVGDVHGEADALAALLHHLGYQDNGVHPAGRHLVFVGDLCDRGPDSPTVVRWVRDAVQQGKAWAILGNHELNLLIGEHRDGNDWFWNEQAPHDLCYHPWKTLPGQGPDVERSAFLSFFSRLPLALERPDLRIVHAAWHAPSVAVLRRMPEHLGLRRHFDALEVLAMRRVVMEGLADRHAEEQARWGMHIDDPQHPMPLLDAHARVDERRQMSHPIRVLTSGVERRAEQPFFAAGRWRFTQRQPWWQHYDDATPVVVGHYWRRLYPERTGQLLGSRERDPFGGASPLAWMGRRRNVFCVDFSAGARYIERRRQMSPDAAITALAALRWPERELVTDRGDRWPTQNFAPQRSGSARPVSP